MYQHQGRVKLAVPVEVVVEKNSARRVLPARTVDASALGARLKDVPGDLSVNEIVTICYCGRQCSFRVAWVGAAGSACEGHIGMECLDPTNNLWGIDFGESTLFSLDALMFPWESQNNC